MPNALSRIRVVIMTSDLTTELAYFQDNLDRFIIAEVLPHYEQWEKDEIFPRSLWTKLGEQGFLAVEIPEQYGGAGASFLFSALVLERFFYHNCSSIGSALQVHNDIVPHYILRHGTEAQKQHYLPKMVSGECIGAIGMSEPAAGSDLQGLKMRAKQDGDEFIINGSKTFISNGQHCDLIALAARTNTEVKGSKGTSVFLFNCDTSGFKRGRILEKIGLHASDTSELFFEDCHVPQTAVLGQVDEGFAILMGELQRERLAIAVSAIAAAEGVLEQTVAYVKERKAFGQAIAEFQNTKFTIAEIATEVKMNRAFVEQCKHRFMQGELTVADASMAKYATTDMQYRIADRCLQLHGGYGYMKEYGVSRAYLDARVQCIYGGTNEIMKEIIGRDVLN